MKTQTSKTRALLAGAALVALVATPLARAQDYQSTVLSQGPVGYWRLNETVQPQPGTTANNAGSLGSAANGTYNAFPTTGMSGPFAGSSAVGLDGSSQTISTPANASLNPSTFSFEIWAKPALVPNFAYLASSVQSASPRSGWYLAQDNGSTFGHGNSFVVRTFKSDGTTPAAEVWATNDLPSGAWYHLVLTYDGNTCTLYKNGVAVSTSVTNAYVPNTSAQFVVGQRNVDGFFWPGQVAEVAAYSGALSAPRVAAHYTAATTTPGSYASTVGADAPLLYWRFQEQGSPPAANLGTLGTAGNGMWMYDTRAGVNGPKPTTFPGFDVTNSAAAFDAQGGVVRLAPLNLNTNTVTISGWLNTTNSQLFSAGLVVCNGSGLIIDPIDGGYGIGATWGNNNYGWAPSRDSGLPTLPDSQWAYVAMVVQPSQTALFICDRNNYQNFTSVTNNYQVNNANQTFSTATLVGSADGSITKSFNGAIDEVAIFNRALGSGELYTQYGAAVGGVPPRIFNELQGPAGTVPVGDPLVLNIDAGGTPPLTFTWKRGGTTVGTTSSNTFTIASAALTDSGNYDVTISNGSGSAGPSQQVSVTVVTPSTPAIVDRLGFYNRTLYKGATLKLGVVATGGGLKYQWYKNSSAIAAATASMFIIPSVTNTDAGSYSVSVTNTLGTASNSPVVITIPVVSDTSYEGNIVSTAPEAWWRLDETVGSTNLIDGMGRHDGVYTNLLGTVPPVALGAAGALVGDPNTAASFTPAYQGVGLIPWSPTLNPNKSSIEAWVKTSVVNADGIVPFSSYDGTANGSWCQAIGGWWYGDTSGGYFGNNNNVNTLAQIVPGEWSHVVILYDPTRIISGTYYPFVLYVNGATDGYVWGGTTTPNGSGPFIIGGRNLAPPALVDRLFDGQVDEVAVYGRILSATEIQAHFAARGTITTPPTFVGAPLAQTVTTGKSVTFTASVVGTTPINLQWYKGGTLLSGATTTSYNIPSTVLGDTGTYTLWATNVAGVNSQSVSLTVISPVGYANVTNNLVLHMRFEGDTTDSSGRGNNGAAVGSPAFVPGTIGSQALQYETVMNGTNFVSASYVNLGRPADLQFGASTSFSIGLWVKTPAGSLQGDVPFIGIATNSFNNPGWDLGPSYKLGGWQWCLHDGANNFDVSGPDNSMNDGNWHHFILTVDRTTKVASSYFNGVLTATRDITSLGSVDNNILAPVIIGQDPTFTYPEAGSSILDDLGIWRRALTALEVAQVESAGAAGNSFDTVAPAEVTITFTRSGSSVTLSWTSGTLLQSDTLGAGASWTAVPGASAPSYTFTPATTGNKFYRVQVSP
jgi:hypothetical protein